MKESDKIWIASIAITKKMDYETLKYSDYMYGKEELTDDVWKYVEECEVIGTVEFKKKYSQYKFYF